MVDSMLLRIETEVWELFCSQRSLWFLLNWPKRFRFVNIFMKWQCWLVTTSWYHRTNKH